ncbi:hypothetical protein CLIB1444_01S13102 [[Candida] jaroonii]|uniref:Uncharacterized protein n=1 Tax=[Candida] jaroonii TaxID=467808 RepID=A0ACA9Y1A3_9ASCO|nr:hypothetical protein CLIB1444_01S13102 [[Candida] jaroonii]
MFVRKFHSSTKALSDFSHVIIGGGIIGTSIAAELSKKSTSNNILLIEKEGSLGTETTSRNSEVIHGGLYYPKDSLKSKFCIEGKELIYNALKTGTFNPLQVGINQCGKLIVAQNDEEIEQLEKIHQICNDVGVETNFVSKETVKSKYPLLKAQLALNSPSTGIISVHDYLLYFQTIFENNQGTVVFNTKVKDIDKQNDSYVINCQDEDGEFEISSDVIINAGGLHAPKISNYLLPPDRKYKGYYGKGTYFAYQPKENPGKMVDTLIYPCPNPNAASLGTHLTFDMGGQIKFGPDLEMLDIEDPDEIDYTPSERNLIEAHKAVTRYLPHIKLDELVPSYTGVRPKIGHPKDGFADFIVKEEEGFPGFFNLLGIESPGVTSAWAIAKHVSNLAK